jgi:hypothetical protein
MTSTDINSQHVSDKGTEMGHRVIGNTLTPDPERMRATLRSNGVTHGKFWFVGPGSDGFYKIVVDLTFRKGQQK